MKQRMQPRKGGFHLVRTFTIEHNAARLRTYADRLGRKVRRERGMARFVLKARRKGGLA